MDPKSRSRTNYHPQKVAKNSLESHQVYEYYMRFGFHKGESVLNKYCSKTYSNMNYMKSCLANAVKNKYSYCI